MHSPNSAAMAAQPIIIRPTIPSITTAVATKRLRKGKLVPLRVIWGQFERPLDQRAHPTTQLACWISCIGARLAHEEEVQLLHGEELIGRPNWHHSPSWPPSSPSSSSRQYNRPPAQSRCAPDRLSPHSSSTAQNSCPTKMWTTKPQNFIRAADNQLGGEHQTPCTWFAVDSAISWSRIRRSST